MWLVSKGNIFEQSMLHREFSMSSAFHGTHFFFLFYGAAVLSAMILCLFLEGQDVAGGVLAIHSQKHNPLQHPQP